MKTRTILSCMTLLSGFMLSGAALAKPIINLFDIDSAVKVTESGTSKQFEIKRSGSDTNIDLDVKIKFGKAAKFGEDFTVNTTASVFVFDGPTGDFTGTTTVTLNIPDEFIIVTMPANSPRVRVTVEPIDDFIDEGDDLTKEDLDIELAKKDKDTGDYDQGSVKKIETKVLDNDTAAIVISEISGTTTTEAGGSMTFKVNLATEPTKTVEVTIESDDTTEGIPSPTTLTFNPSGGDLWSTKQMVTVTGQPDDGDVGAGTPYKAIIKGPSGGGTESIYKNLADQEINLTNTNVGGVPGQISTDLTYQVNEGAGTIQVRAFRFGGKTGAASVNYTTTAGTPGPNGAIAGTDYTTKSGTFNWNDNEDGSRFESIPINNDNIVEQSETLTFNLSGATGASIATATGTITILDDDSPGVISIDPASVAFSVNEGVGTATITVIRTGDDAGAVSARYDTANGSAIAGSDYTGVTNGTVSFAADDSAPKTINITITDDMDDEPDQDFTVTLSAPTGGATLGASKVSTVTIQDNDSVGVLTIDPASISVSEGAGTANVTVKRTGGSSGPVSATVNTSNGSAIAPSDYTAISGGTVSFIDGQTEKTIPVTIMEDNNDEGDQDFTVVISSATNGATIDNNTGTVTITDNDNAGVIAISPAAYPATEGGANPVITITRTGGSDGAVSVTANTANGSAVAPDDYIAVIGQVVNFAHGDAVSKTIPIPIINDGDTEAAQSFTITITNPTNGATLGNPTGTVTIAASDTLSGGTFTIEPDSISVNEDAGTANVTVKRVGGTSGAAHVDYNTIDGSAKDENTLNDYTAKSGTLDWLDGNSDDQVISVSINDDSEAEGDENFVVYLSQVTGDDPVTLGNDMGTVTINASDTPGTISIESATYNVGENAGSVTITFTRTLGANGVVGATVNTANLDATAGSDYTAVVAGSVSFGDGVTTNQTINIPIADDKLDEVNEQFTVNLSTATGGASLGTMLSTVTILDDDSAGVIAIDPASVMVEEDAGTASVTVTRTGGIDGAVSATVNTANGSALAGTDYIAIAGGSVNFADQDGASKTISVGIINDTDPEPDQDFTVTLTAPANGATLGNPVGTVTIKANDTPGNLQIDPASVVVDENVGTANITVTRTGGSIGAASVNFATADGSAKDENTDNDYKASAGTLNWADGDSASKTISVIIVDDAVDEEAEMFTVTLSGATGADLGASTAATVTINKSDGLATDKGTVSIDPASYTVDEFAGLVSVLVTRTVGSDGEISANYTTVVGTAGASDFTPKSGSLTWADGDAATKVISIAITDDSLIEPLPNEAFTVVLSNLTEEVTPGNLVGTVQIRDDDNPDAGTVIASNVVTVEKDGAVLMTVERLGGADGALEVTWSTADNSAISGGNALVGEDDYVATGGTLNWADGENGAKQVSVTIKEDLFAETAETIDVVFDYVENDAPVSTIGTITIYDNDSSGELTISDITVYEEERMAMLTVKREGSDAGIAFVEYRTVDGTARDENTDNDYTSQTGSFTWLEGEGCQGAVCVNGERQIYIPIRADFLREGDEYFTVELFNEEGSDGTASSISVTKRVGRVDIIDPVPIPTLNQWMLLLLALLLGAVGYSQLQRRKQF